MIEPNKGGKCPLFSTAIITTFAHPNSENIFMSQIHIQECPVCGGKDIQKFLQLKDYSISGEDFQLDECRTCGFIMTQDMPDAEAIGPYYKSENYISHSDTNKGFVNKIYHIVRAVMLHKKAEMVEIVSGKKRGSLLDIGTGLAYFPQQMQSKGWKVEGIEQDSEAREAAKQRFDFEVNEPEELLKMENRNFDIISLWHVLEHVHNLDGYMKAIKNNLADDGTLVIALPNPNSPDAKFYRKYWAAWDVPRHLWHWKPETFKRFAEKYGFELIEKKPMPMDGFYVSMLSEKYKGTSMQLFKGIFRGKMTWLKSLNNNDLSSSVIYFLRKS